MKVYAEIDTENRITAVNSAAFIRNPSEWTEIDEGEGDKYALAQSCYFPRGLMTEDGICRYKLTDGVPVERSAAELAADAAEKQNPAASGDVTELMLELLAEHEYRLCMAELGL